MKVLRIIARLNVGGPARHVAWLEAGLRRRGFESVLIPKGVVHAYRNTGAVDGIVFNCPNRLYMGEGKKTPIDEIRHEDDPDTIYRMEG